MGRYYSPSGRCEIWDEPPAGYMTEEEWAALHPPPPPPEPPPEEIIAEYDAALEEKLRQDRYARGYTLREPSGYDDSPCPRYNQDAIDWKYHVARTMIAGLTALNDYKATGQIPTKEEFLASLPTITWTIDPDNTNPGEGMYIPE